MESVFSVSDIALYDSPKKGRFQCILQNFGKTLLRFMLSLWLLVTLCFFLIRLMPGDPFHDEQNVPPEVIQSLKATWGMKGSLVTQYFSYISHLIQGDLGNSMRYPSESVTNIIRRGFSTSFFLGLQALCIAFPLGILFGTVTAYRANKPFDIAASFGATLGISTPSFVVATILQLAFATLLPVLPFTQYRSCCHMILASFALSLGPLCSTMRLTRANVLDVLSKEWIVTARMKGLSEWKVLIYHVVPNALLPIIHYIGPTVTNLLVGSFVIERVFGIPGLGQWFVNGVIVRDYNVISGLTLFYALILFIVHSIINAISMLLNPRFSEEPLL